MHQISGRLVYINKAYGGNGADSWPTQFMGKQPRIAKYDTYEDRVFL